MGLNAAAIQFTIVQGDVEHNLSIVRTAVVRAAEAGSRLIVLPEMWSTGFAYGALPELAQTMTQAVLNEIAALSRQYQLVIVGSQPVNAEDGRVYNTAHIIDCGEVIAAYRKIHLFSLLGEDRYFKAGEQWCVVDSSVGRIGVIICYDLRFPELCRRLTLEGAQVICVPAQWPKPRQEHWRTLIRARAIENQLYLIAANACGRIGKLDLFGMSMIVNHQGEVLAEGAEEPETIMAALDWEPMSAWRAQIPCLHDRRPALY